MEVGSVDLGKWENTSRSDASFPSEQLLGGVSSAGSMMGWLTSGPIDWLMLERWDLKTHLVAVKIVPSEYTVCM